VEIIGIGIVVALGVLLAIILVLELAGYRRFLEQRDIIIQSILDIQAVVNTNAEIQEKMKTQILLNAQDIDAMEKMISVHSNALKILGPVLLRLEDIDLGKVVKVEK
jgi:hypothetical protein